MLRKKLTRASPRWLVWPLLVAIGAACGGDDATAPAAARNEPGTGTATLQVIADVDADDLAGGFVTDFEVTLRDAATAPVSAATVTITHASVGAVALVETVQGSGIYQATRLQFATGDYRLDVVRGTDNVQGVVVGDPGAYSITAPQPNDTVLAGQPLAVSWNVPRQATSAEVETDDFGPAVVPDTGAFVISGANNPARADQKVQVFRFNEVTIAGGLPGSRLRVKVRQTVEPVVVQ